MDDVIRRLERYCLKAPGDALVGEALSLILGLLAERAQLTQIIAQKEEERQCLRAALESADSILWMAERYAEGGGQHGPEREDYECAAASVRAALGGG